MALQLNDTTLQLGKSGFLEIYCNTITFYDETTNYQTLSPKLLEFIRQYA